MPAPVIDKDVEAGYWRARDGRAEALVAGLRAQNAGLTARVAELAGQVAALQESVTTPSGLLSWSLSCWSRTVTSARSPATAWSRSPR